MYQTLSCGKYQLTMWFGRQDVSYLIWVVTISVCWLSATVKLKRPSSQRCLCWISTASPPRGLMTTLQKWPRPISTCKRWVFFFYWYYFLFFNPFTFPITFEIFTNKNDSFVQIRKKLLAKQTIMERSEKAKKLREQRKYGKKVCVCFSYFCPFVFLLNRINFKKVELQDCTRLYWELDCNSFKPFVTPKWHPYKTVRMGWK